MTGREWSRDELAAMWIFGAFLTGGVLLALYFWPHGQYEWLAVGTAATLAIYHVWKIRTTLMWLQDEYGFRFGDPGGEDFYRTDEPS